KDATGRRWWEHQPTSRKVCRKGTSAGAASLYVMRSRVPSGRWTSTSVVGVRQGAATSTKCGGDGSAFGTRGPLSASRGRLRAWGVSPSCLATRGTEKGTAD